MRHVLSVAVLLFVAGAAHAADHAERWTFDHPEAHRALLNLFDDKPNFRNKFLDVASEDPGIISKWVVFLAERGDRNTNDFVEKFGREAKGVKQMHENYAEHVRKFREWVRDHERAAVALADIRGGFKRALELRPVEIKRKRGRD